MEWAIVTSCYCITNAHLRFRPIILDADADDDDGSLHKRNGIAFICHDRPILGIEYFVCTHSHTCSSLFHYLRFIIISFLFIL